MVETTQSSRPRVRWLWGKLSAVLLFAGLYLLNYQPAVRENAALEAAVAAGLLLGTVGVASYVWRYYAAA